MLVAVGQRVRLVGSHAVGRVGCLLYTSIQTTLYTRETYHAFLVDYHRRQLPALAFYVGLIACLLFIGLFAMAQYVTNRDTIYAVSYTHLDVYKRQDGNRTAHR